MAMFNSFIKLPEGRYNSHNNHQQYILIMRRAYGVSYSMSVHYYYPPIQRSLLSLAAAELLHVPFTLVSCGNAGCCSGTPLGSGTEPLPQPYKHSPSMTSVSPSKQPQLTFRKGGCLYVFVREFIGWLTQQPTSANLESDECWVYTRTEMWTKHWVWFPSMFRPEKRLDETKQPEHHTIV